MVHGWDGFFLSQKDGTPKKTKYFLTFSSLTPTIPLPKGTYGKKILGFHLVVKFWDNAPIEHHASKIFFLSISPLHKGIFGVKKSRYLKRIFCVRLGRELEDFLFSA